MGTEYFWSVFALSFTCELYTGKWSNSLAISDDMTAMNLLTVVMWLQTSVV